MSVTSPEIGQCIQAAGIETNLHDQGEGQPVLFIHGSGRGVTAWANRRLVLRRSNITVVSINWSARF